MNTTRQFLGLIGALSLSLLSLPASAISTIGNCDVNDVTSQAYGAADACYGLVRGNISEDGTQGYEGLIPDSAFGGAFAGNNWQVQAISFDVATHTWSGNLNGFDELIVILKQSTLWGAWYFNPADNFGAWSTVWTYPNGNGGQGGGLSHGFALVRGQGTSVPEPGTLALFGMALLGAGLARRARR